MFTLNRSLLFINSEFVVCMFENIEVFFFLIEFFWKIGLGLSRQLEFFYASFQECVLLLCAKCG